MAHIGQIDHDLDQTDGSDDNEPDHLDPNLPLLDAVRDLYSTDPTQEICPRSDHADYTAPTRLHVLLNR